MRFRKLEGFEAIRAKEPENALNELKTQLEEKTAQGTIEFSVTGAKEKNITCTTEDTVAELAEKCDGAADGTKVQYVHIGYPLGVMVPVSGFDRKVGELFGKTSVMTGSFELHVFGESACPVDYMGGLLRELKEESCGRCVLCRMALQQLGIIFDDAVNGRGRADDKNTVTAIAEAMQLGAHCPFGKAAGALTQNFAEDFADELEDHAKRRVCKAGVCKKYMTYHILGTKCTGCGDCEDVCNDDAITGKKGFIYMIDTFDCTGCGKCIEECEEEAIIVAGVKKPKTPDKLTKVGRWKKDY